MAELQVKVTAKNVLTRADGTPALGANEARIVVETDYSPLQIMQAIRKLETELASAFTAIGGSGFAAFAFSDNARFDDGASFSDQNVLGL